MGTDYMPGEGIVTGIENIVDIISDDNKEAIIKAIREWHGTDEERSEFFKDLADDITTDDLKAKLIAHCEVSGEAARYEGSCHLTHVDSDDLCELWNALSEASGTDLPYIEEVRVFDSYRKHADCPIGEASFIFSEGDLYERTLNSGGEFLSELCGGYLNEVTWTDVSY